MLGPTLRSSFLRHGLVGRAQARVNGFAQIHLAHVHALSRGRPTQVLDVDHAQGRVFQRQLVAPCPALGELRAEPPMVPWTSNALAAPFMGTALQRDGRAAVVKAGLVDLDALVAAGWLTSTRAGIFSPVALSWITISLANSLGMPVE
jgi:hypothetical protein